LKLARISYIYPVKQFFSHKFQFVLDVRDLRQNFTSGFSNLFSGGFSSAKMCSQLIVTIIRHFYAISARIAHHPLYKLWARQEARDCPFGRP
jgi:hypothetical protein